MPRALSKKNARRLIKAARNPSDKAILELLYATGRRISELLNVCLGHVDFRKQTIMVNGKRAKAAGEEVFAVQFFDDGAES